MICMCQLLLREITNSVKSFKTLKILEFIQHLSNGVYVSILQLHYSFNKVLLLQEPLLVVGAFYLLFMLVIIYVRMDFAISKVSGSHILLLLSIIMN